MIIALKLRRRPCSVARGQNIVKFACSTCLLSRATVPLEVPVLPSSDFEPILNLGSLPPHFCARYGDRTHTSRRYSMRGIQLSRDFRHVLRPPSSSILIGSGLLEGLSSSRIADGAKLPCGPRPAGNQPCGWGRHNGTTRTRPKPNIINGGLWTPKRSSA